MKGNLRVMLSPLLSWPFCLIVVTLLGMVLRLVFLGRWSLYGDEWFTLNDAAEIGQLPFSEMKPAIRTFPLIYILTRMVTAWWGYSEWVLRLLPCVFGILAVPLSAMLARPVAGKGNALIAALFMAISPWLLFHSQMARFYTGASLFGMIAIFLLYRGISMPSLTRMWVGMSSLLVAMLFHPSAAMILPVFIFYSLTIRFVDRSVRLPPIRYYIPLLLPLLCGGLFLIFNFSSFVDIMLVNLAQSPTWAYSVAHLLLGIVYNFGYHIFLFAIFGFITLWHPQRALAYYLMLHMGLTVLVLAVLAFLGKATGQRYTLAVISTLYLLAGCGVYTLIGDLFQKNRIWFVVALMAFLVPFLPSLLSHYKDGDRLDFRKAAVIIGEQLREDDAVISQTHAILLHYLDEYYKSCAGMKPSDLRIFEASSRFTGEWLDNVADSAQRIWIVLEESRYQAGPGFFTEEFRSFIRDHCRLVTEIFQTRYDYHRNVLRVYLFESGSKR
ncbi:MAG: glycosyltransferase family 39 protein [Planctomycetota bacterium]